MCYKDYEARTKEAMAKSDLENGIITEESACELMTNLWLKTFTINKIRSWSHTQFSAGSPLYQNVTVGGQTVDKKDAVKEEDAYNYSAIGCVETAVPGKWGYRCTGMSFLNFPKSLLIAMNDGVDLGSGVKVAEGVGHFVNMTSFADIEKAWDKIIRDFTRHSVIIETCCDMVLEETVTDILCSSLVEDCIGRGKTLNSRVFQNYLQNRLQEEYY